MRVRKLYIYVVILFIGFLFINKGINLKTEMEVVSYSKEISNLLSDKYTTMHERDMYGEEIIRIVLKEEQSLDYPVDVTYNEVLRLLHSKYEKEKNTVEGKRRNSLLQNIRIEVVVHIGAIESVYITDIKGE